MLLQSRSAYRRTRNLAKVSPRVSAETLTQKPQERDTKKLYGFVLITTREAGKLEGCSFWGWEAGSG